MRKLISDQLPEQLKLPFALWTRKAVAGLLHGSRIKMICRRGRAAECTGRRLRRAQHLTSNAKLQTPNDPPSDAGFLCAQRFWRLVLDV